MTITKEAIEAAKRANTEAKLFGGEPDDWVRAALEAALPFLSPIAVEGKDDAEALVENFEKAFFSRCLAETGARKKAYLEARAELISHLSSSPGKDGGQEVEAVGCPGDKCEHFWEEAPCCNGWRPQPASTALVERLTKALEEISDTRCVHDMGFDREIGPLGCSLGDKCVCVGLCTIASRALQEITTKALEGQELQAVAWRWKWKDCGSWIVTEGEPDENERRIIEPLYKSAHVAEPVEYHIVFDEFPSPEGPRFIEVENAAGQSINAGEWRKRADGLCELVIKAGAHAHG